MWDFYDSNIGYSKAGVPLSTLKYKRIIPNNINRQKARILVILGHGEKLNTKKDKEHLENILKDGEIIPLIEPSSSYLCKKLYEKEGWDLIFFAGHSYSDLDLKTGNIKINSEETLTIDDFKNALEESIHNGLKLAIFNSCDGFTLAQNLAQLNIPQVIVMGENIPDSVAPEFLEYFLQEFYGKKSLLLAVRNAQKKLQNLEKKFPGVSWLPVIFKNPTEKILTWQKLPGVIEQQKEENKIKQAEIEKQAKIDQRKKLIRRITGALLTIFTGFFAYKITSKYTPCANL